MVHARCRLHALRRRALGRGRARGPHGNAACIGTRRSFPQAKVRVGLRESAGAAGVWRGPCRWRCTHVNPLPVGTRGDAGRLPGRRAVWASILNGVSGGVLVCRNAPPKIVCVTPSDSPTSGEVRSTAHRPSSGVRSRPHAPQRNRPIQSPRHRWPPTASGIFRRLSCCYYSPARLISPPLDFHRGRCRGDRQPDSPALAGRCAGQSYGLGATTA